MKKGKGANQGTRAIEHSWAGTMGEIDWGEGGVGVSNGRKGGTTVSEQQLKNKINKMKYSYLFFIFSI